ncbi:hypothetical protein COT44_04980 [Candidatus Shapirobacteria bacterium CG08_land_8_20_14_0_20_39_18]|uniref:Uncharacterized protein n=1 Tax=Candidatus Shapirobacteria bacterium CG08_land_8_20_14_0_20_39_18 TaxID=1974883 RepID=A0A2M6XBP7_9BACT|nr:MAG: hypothetical protein COT44_04980 [Candidatus Shapirobacteria bacterium CG08_land_8_20_14_0_20_39_18]PIY64890.1 MAG: hypothetical protein COY91_04025 [Candidatus Shapirobacteria bacterium CG_4_10_14_0_8_um_filter_39_15]
MLDSILGLTILTSVIISPVSLPADFVMPETVIRQEIAQKTLDLNIRPEGFGENILIALRYLENQGKIGEIREPFEVAFALYPGQVFAFHPNVLPEFADPAVTMNSYFLTTEGYKSVFGLGGNGVCHLASLINWAALEAGLQVTALANHDFFPIPGIDKKWGVSIMSTDPRQNLYIKNNLEEPVIFWFTADTSRVELKILK